MYANLAVQEVEVLCRSWVEKSTSKFAKEEICRENKTAKNDTISVICFLSVK